MYALTISTVSKHITASINSGLAPHCCMNRTVCIKITTNCMIIFICNIRPVIDVANRYLHPVMVKQ
jgi:hypothetical protein